ncbi:MAG: electron transfer flavoprotein alpha subunit [Sulfurimonas sp.]|jgi:electron transfer flavoprotein alpha subunit
MSIGAIGSAIYTNQMTANVSSVQNAHNNRVDFQNMAAQAAVNEKDEKVLKVRPTEENQEVDPDREHQKNEADQETARSEHKDKESEEEKKESEFPLHKLDIKV